MDKKSVELFLYELIALIDHGKKESIEDVEKQIENGNIAEYILGKYKDIVMGIVDDRIKHINESYYDLIGYVSGNESRKFGITKEDNGLLLLVSVGVMILGE